MPIKGITEVRELPRLGKIKAGIKQKKNSGAEFPEEVPYFVLNPIEPVRNKKGEIIGTKENKDIKKLIEMYGTDNPEEMSIVFPIDNDEIICSHYMKWWVGNHEKGQGQLMCKGDGEFACYSGRETLSGMGLGPDAYPPGMNRICNRLLCPQAIKSPDGKAPVCKPNMNLMFLIPQHSLYGVFQLDTTSEQCIKGVVSTLALARSVLRSEGIPSIAGVPMRLFRRSRRNSHRGQNHIITLQVDSDALKIEKQKLQEGRPTSLAMGYEQQLVKLQYVEELEPDLVPKSQFPNEIQTGDPILIDAPKPDFDEWLKDDDIITRFNTLADLTGTICSPGRMKATVQKFTSKEELKKHLDKKLSTEQKKVST